MIAKLLGLKHGSFVIWSKISKANLYLINLYLLTFRSVWERSNNTIPDIPVDGVKYDHFGSGVVADFDADGFIDILIPLCRDKSCNYVDFIMIYSYTKGWVYFQIDLKDSTLATEVEDAPTFRVGDFTLDGYPDLIATINKGNTLVPVIFENVEYSGNTNFSR